MNEPHLISKNVAAKLLGVSLPTFDRIRKRRGIKPVPHARLKPLLFLRLDIEALDSQQEQTDENGILSLNEVKRRAKRKGAR